jgi:hypothetical protein
LYGGGVVQGGLDPNKISGVGTNFGRLVLVLPEPNQWRALEASKLLSFFGDKTISPAASFVVGIHFANSYFCDLRCPFGQIDNRKHMFVRNFFFHFQKIY